MKKLISIEGRLMFAEVINDTYNGKTHRWFWVIDNESKNTIGSIEPINNGYGFTSYTMSAFSTTDMESITILMRSL